MIAQVQVKQPQPSVQLMTVTPTMAANWLEHANTRNRPMSEAYAEKLARDIREGRWMLTHEGIAFDTHGVLLDGQTRLWAIMLADRPVPLHVWFNITPEALMAINSGRSRSLTDILKLAGGHGDVGHREMAVLRAMLGGLGGNVSLTAAEASDALGRHREAIGFALEVLPKTAYSNGISTATTRAVAGRAFYSADRARVKSFGQMLVSGIIPAVSAGCVLLLRQALTAIRGGTREERRDRYGKTERALLAFLRGEHVTKLYASTQELFPLPEETTN